ncbi:ATP-binding protein [Streptomyces sp. bgisy091]|uniref:ATP-binding protein n=1 Tax=Streptomyces sp. bgisy091 TaxID=3413778 RepID=UPI003D72C2F5
MTAAQPDATCAFGYTAELPCVPESVGRARALVSSALTAWGMSEDLADSGEVIVSELLTNAVTHTRTSTTKVIIERQGESSVRIAVSDRSHAAPFVKASTDDSESGRGLSLVGALSERWGYDTDRWGKVTWALITNACRSSQ